jgi:Zn-finger nucleic acid-binding protein
MHRVHYRSLELYRCSVCAGFYLEREELDVLHGAALRAFSLRLNEHDRDRGFRHCFRCSTDMDPVEGPAGLHLDRCEVCEAVFLEEKRLAEIRSV